MIRTERLTTFVLSLRSLFLIICIGLVDLPLTEGRPSLVFPPPAFAASGLSFVPTRPTQFLRTDAAAGQVASAPPPPLFLPSLSALRKRLRSRYDASDEVVERSSQ